MLALLRSERARYTALELKHWQRKAAFHQEQLAWVAAYKAAVDAQAEAYMEHQREGDRAILARLDGMVAALRPPRS